MRSRVARKVVCAALAGAALLCASAVHAQTAVLLSPPDASEIRELRVAHSSTGDHASLWFSLKLYGGADDVFVVVPAPAGAKVDVSTDAWFEALSAGTNLRILPPTSAPTCGTKPAPNSYETIGVDSHVETLAPDPAVAVRTFAEVVVWAKGEGLVLTMDQTSRLADLEVQGNRFVTVRFQPQAGESVTRTVRVSPTSQLTAVPLLLTSAGSTRVPTTVWAFAAGRAWPANRPGLIVDTAKLQWSPSGNSAHSNYGVLWDSMLAAAQGHAWIVDSASHEGLFRSTPFAGGTDAIPAIGATYFERAAGYGDASSDYQGCAARFAALEWSHSRVAKACGRGDLTTVDPQTAPACKEEMAPGETAPDELRCGKIADDLAIALSAATPADTWLTRWTGYIPAWVTRDSEAVELKPGAAISNVLTCSTYDKDCGADGGAGSGGQSGNPNQPDGGAGGPGQGGAGGAPPGGGSGAYGGSTGGPGTGNPYPPEEDCYDCGGGSNSTVYASGSCSGDSSSSSGSSDSCSGNSSDSGGDSCSSSSDSGGDSCSGSSDSGGDSCSGSSDSGGDSCSGDSSGSGDSCSGSSSSGGGDSCSGSSSGGGQSCSGSSGGGSDCSVAKGRSGRRLPPLSGVTLGLVALLLPLRRRFKR
ncbi:MAG: DUF2330 domain-containing protein [Deltaproteobacteria bacterium]|nr:DUF2330 domain-containing protein [Deltaproteobacteria bacterium]